MELDLRLALPGGHLEVPAGEQPGAALAVVLYPAGLVAQWQPAAIGELDLDDRCRLGQADRPGRAAGSSLGGRGPGFGP